MEAFLAEKSLDAGELPWYTETRGIFLWQLKRPQERFMDNLKKFCRVTLLFWKCTNATGKFAIICVMIILLMIKH